jgi:hypothetical protein
MKVKIACLPCRHGQASNPALSGQNFRFFVPKQQVLLCLNQKSCYLENTSKLKPGAFKKQQAKRLLYFLWT